MMTFFISFVIALAGSAFFSGMETGSYSINRVRLNHRLKQGSKSARILFKNLQNPQLFIFTVLVGNNCVNYFISSETTNFVIKAGIAPLETIFIFNFFPWSAEIAATFILMIPVFIFGEFLPKNIFRKKAETLMYRLASLQRIFLVLFFPITYPLKVLARTLTSRAGKDMSIQLKNIDMGLLHHYISEGRHDGMIGKMANNMINRTINIAEVPVTDVMLPLENASAIPVDSAPGECLKLFGQNEIMRIPVYSGKPSNIVGIVRFFDILTAVDNHEKNIGTCIREIIRLDVNTSLQKALFKMQGQKEAIALVSDRKGNSYGIIRLRDIIGHITSSKP